MGLQPFAMRENGRYFSQCRRTSIRYMDDAATFLEIVDAKGR